MIKVANGWKDYEIIATGDGQKLERWGKLCLLRPDPQIIWHPSFKLETYPKINATYHRSSTGGGGWTFSSKVPDNFTIERNGLKFSLKLMGFKHTGLFPEQAVNWDAMQELIKKANRPIKVLNLFAYTGAASVVSLYAGAEVVHVDSSKGMTDWAKENVKLNNLDDKPIRYLIDDVVKFVKREIRRGNKYDAIIMDPPSYGRGSNGEVWSLDKDLENLIKLCKEILSDNFLFFIVNTYSTNLPNISLENILKINFKDKNILVDDLCLPIENSNLYLSCGITGRVTDE